MKRIWLYLMAGAIAAIIGASLVFADSTGTIKGLVCDSQSGLPVPGARVMIDNTPMGALVNPADGSYVILNVKPGTYKLISDCIGYNKLIVSGVVVKADSTTIVYFKLVSEAVKDGDITLRGVPPTITKSVSTCTHISRAESKSFPVMYMQGVIRPHSGVVSQGGPINIRGSRCGFLGKVDDGIIIKDPLGGYGGIRYSNPADFNTEQYNRIYDNSFLDPRDNPLSTFSIDVDAASYSNVRRFITGGQLPPPDAVRTEELINYFRYDYPQPDGELPFSITTDLSSCPWNEHNKLLLIGLQGKNIEMRNLPPNNLVFLIDVSGSMMPENKLPLLKTAFKMLVNNLREQDRIAIVVYAGSSGLVLPTTAGNQKATILAALDNLEAGGCTAGSAGMKQAYEEAKKNFDKNANNRVIWATDGDFNVGPSSDAEMIRLVEERRDQGIFLTMLGFGEGNLKDSRMEQIADKGNGNYYYIDCIQEANRVLVGQLGGTLFTIAKDVKLQIEFNPVRVQAYRLIGYENRLLANEDFNDDKKDAGEMGSGHSVTALYEIVPTGEKIDLPDVDELKYQRPVNSENDKYKSELLTVKVRYKEPKENVSKKYELPVTDRRQEFAKASQNLRFAAAIAEFSMLLRDSQYKGDLKYNDVIEIAKKAKGEDEDGYRGEFVRLVESCRDLAGTSSR